MNEHVLHTKDLNSSLVFYRSLFDRMPDSLNAFEIVFQLENLRLRILESGTLAKKRVDPFHLKMGKIKMKKVLNKMRRFTRLNQMKEDCEKPEDAFGLMDPDGYKWIIGEYRENVSFEKCYINL